VITVIADTSGLLAALDSTHPEHGAANEAIMAAGLLVMSPLLPAELDRVATHELGHVATHELGHVATHELGRVAAVGAVDDLRRRMSQGRVAMPEITQHHLGAAQSVRVRYGSLDLDLADAVNVASAAEYDTDTILTLDRGDFRAVRPLGRHKAFRVLPDDLPLRRERSGLAKCP
jgi:predicted nucleic acid-binding protein